MKIWKFRKIKREKQENVEQSRFQANKSVKVVFDLHENWIFVTENDNCCKNNAIEDKIIIIKEGMFQCVSTFPWNCSKCQRVEFCQICQKIMNFKCFYINYFYDRNGLSSKHPHRKS